ncbi:MAG: type I-U CRISPR-associated protein Csx17 [Deltaproteobacteria bacterium]|nr:type I-U CRISPR-associated protein Csx17 [Deltaproteobacteria bacterium]
MPEHVLTGCQPEPLGAYLKALGVLRLVSEQADASARGRWTPEGFAIQTTLGRDALKRFFLEEYRPTPVANPWNGAGGFYFRNEKDTGVREKETTATKTLSEVVGSAAARLGAFRDALEVARREVDRLGLSEAPKEEAKVTLVNRLRDRLSDEAVGWLDAALVVDVESLGFPPILGTGGTEGALDFASNFYQRLAEVFDFGSGAPTKASDGLWSAAIFGRPTKGLTKAAIGQFDPQGVGGGNAAPGFSGDSLVNPWDFILLLEGTLLLASATTRKLDQVGPGALTYPFSVRAVGAGYASSASADEDKSRNELWLPLWKRPTGREELARLFGEGRAEIGRKAAVHAVDFVRAIGTLGVDRGIDAFTRYGFHQRNGKSYFATPLGRWEVRRNPKLDLIDEPLARWLDQLRRAARAQHAAASWGRAAKAVERAIFELAKAEGPLAVQALMGTLADAEATFSRSPAGREKLRPVPPLPQRWLAQARDGSFEHQLAMSLASTPIRERLTLARWGKRQVSWMAHEDYRTVWGEAPLARGLADVVAREDIESAQVTDGSDGRRPTLASRPPLASALRAFLEGTVDLERLDALVRAYALVHPSNVGFPSKPASRPVSFLPPGYALCALAVHRVNPVTPDDPKTRLPRTPGILAALRRGDGTGATAAAARRLRAAGLALAVEGVPMTSEQCARVAAALAFPCSDELARICVRSIALAPEAADGESDATPFVDFG